MSGWTKLFSSIVTSSVWCEDHATVRVWVAMLAVGDADGIVEGSLPGFANLARVTVEEMRAAVDKLSSPDPDSRTPDHEGRRIEAIEGGWRILNHGRYREKAQAKEGSRAPYFRDYRARKAAEAEAEAARAQDAAKKAKDAKQKTQQPTVARNTEERGEKQEEGTDAHTHARAGQLLDEIACTSCGRVGFLVQSPGRGGNPPGWWCRNTGGCGFNFPLDHAPILKALTPGARKAIEDQISRSQAPATRTKAESTEDAIAEGIRRAQERGVILGGAA